MEEIMQFGVPMPYTGVFDYDEGFRQNPDEPEYYVPLAERIRVNGIETREQAGERARRMLEEFQQPGETTEEAEARIWKAIAARRAEQQPGTEGQRYENPSDVFKGWDKDAGHMTQVRYCPPCPVLGAVG
jgi:hypothetical protein